MLFETGIWQPKFVRRDIGSCKRIELCHESQCCVALDDGVGSSFVNIKSIIFAWRTIVVVIAYHCTAVAVAIQSAQAAPRNSKMGRFVLTEFALEHASGREVVGKWAVRGGTYRFPQRKSMIMENERFSGEIACKVLHLTAFAI